MVLPQNLAGSRDCLAFLRRQMGPKVWVSLMSQYFPAHRAPTLPPLNRKATRREYREAFQALHELGLNNGFVQDCGEDGPACA